MSDHRTVAYFSMEIGLIPEIPTYSGGLGVLAGDTIRAAADQRVPMVGVTLLHRKGYFRQMLDSSGNQREEPVSWVVEDFLDEEPERVSVNIEGRTVRVRAWRREVTGVDGYTVPVYYLGTQLPENSEWDQGLSDYLYGGDSHYRLCQEIVLGVGGVRMLRALGYDRLEHFHINEGHASLLTLELLEERSRRSRNQEVSETDVEAIREQCVFTTHTPVPAGHDRFPADMVDRVLDPKAVALLQRLSCLEGTLNMTQLAMRLSHYVNGVSLRHGEVSRQMFPNHEIDTVTNGVHSGIWVSPPFQELFDRHLPDWRIEGPALRHALRIPNHELWAAHELAKRHLIDTVNRETNVGMDVNVYTIAFARRVATYKRADLIFDNLDRLRRLTHEVGPIQLIFAGKAHPHDQIAKELIRRIFHARDQLQGDIPVAYLQDYDINTCRLLTAGSDLWLNTPEPPLEASGTSGMKAALNGVPSLSILDGWWIEGWIEGVTGWSIGRDARNTTPMTDRGRTACLLYDKLEYVILPMFYENRERYVDVMRHAIAVNGSFFNTHRMMQQYVLRAYLPRKNREGLAL